MKHIRIIFTVITLLAAAGGVSAQTFTASANDATVALNQQFQVSFTFAGQNVNGLSNFKAPDFKGFMVLSGPNQSTSMQFINGAVSGSATYTYYVQARSMGKLTIGSASIEYNGKTFTTQPLAIMVTKGAPQQAAKPQGNNSSISTQEIGDNLFILATSDKKTAYLGEQVTVTYKLYTRVDIAAQMQLAKLPSYEGFWAEEINVPNTISFTNETYQGKQYRVGLLKKVALFPSQLGELSVTPLALDVPVEIQQRIRDHGNLIDQFFNDPFFNNVQTVNYTAKSNVIKLNVIPLPSQNVPKSFTGAVGSYAMSSQVNPTNIKTDEPLTLKIDLSGQGNIQLLNMPELNLPSGLDKYEPKTSEQVDRSGTISGSKSFEYLIVPRTAGKKEIPPIQFSYFNPERRSYVTLSTPSYTINVEQGPQSANSSLAGYSKEEIKLLDQDIRYIKTSTGDLEQIGSSQMFGAGFWTAAILPVVALGGLVSWKLRRDRLEGNVQLLRYRRAEKIARARFKSASALMQANDQTGFYAEISQALFGYLEDKLHIPKSEMSLDRAADELHRRNIDGELVTSLKSSIEKCEYARFAPAVDGAAAMKGMYDDLTKVIIGLERSLAERRHA